MVASGEEEEEDQGMVVAVVTVVEEEDTQEADMVDPENMTLVDLVAETVLNQEAEAGDVEECLEEDKDQVVDMVEKKDMVVLTNVAVIDMKDQKIAIMKMDIGKDIPVIQEVVIEDPEVNGKMKS